MQGTKAAFGSLSVILVGVALAMAMATPATASDTTNQIEALINTCGSVSYKMPGFESEHNLTLKVRDLSFGSLTLEIDEDLFMPKYNVSSETDDTYIIDLVFATNIVPLPGDQTGYFERSLSHVLVDIAAPHHISDIRRKVAADSHSVSNQELMRVYIPMCSFEGAQRLAELLQRFKSES